jgi:hypothetical protein
LIVPGIPIFIAVGDTLNLLETGMVVDAPADWQENDRTLLMGVRS